MIRRSFRCALVCALLPWLAAAGAEAVASSPQLERVIEREMEKRHILGSAVAVLEGGELVWARGFGFADLDETVAVRPDTPFLIGSTSKPFLALAALQLVEAGQLRLDDPAARVLPDLPEPYATLTVRQLLAHTAGVRRDGKRRGPEPYLNHQVYGDELLGLLAGSPLEFAAGSGAAYSNLGPALVALAVEKLSGRSIEDHLGATVFEPAGMAGTRHLRKTDDPRAVDGLASGTVWTGRGFRAGGFESRFPTGSMVSTVLDLAAFVAALERGKLIRAETRDRMWQVQKLGDGRDAILGKDGIGREYGAALGWFVHREDGAQVVHHGGSMEGFSSQIDIDREAGRTVIVVANNEVGPAGALAWRIRDHLRAQDRGEPPAEETMPPLVEVPFDSDRWHIQAEQSRVEKHLGRTSLFLRDGIAWVKDAEFTDGVVELEIAFTGERGFMGIIWRLEGAGNYEQFYVRPHQSGNPDANQYTPAFDGLTSWQLYHGPGYGAPIEYRFDEWNKVRVVVAGERAEVYVNDMERPALFIPELKRAIRQGRVGLNAFNAPAHFSSFRYRAGDPPPLRGESPEMPSAPDGAILTWEVSDPFDWAGLREKTELPAEVAEARTWQTVRAESSGLVNLARFAARGDGKNAVFARVTLTSERERTVALRFGYSDLVRVYLDGRVLYAGDNRYRSRDYRYLGTIGYFDIVYLPLRKGDNQLWLAVAENFGGWGLQATIEDADGVTVRSSREPLTAIAGPMFR